LHFITVIFIHVEYFGILPALMIRIQFPGWCSYDQKCRKCSVKWSIHVRLYEITVHY